MNAEAALREAFSRRASAALKALLETKHLYQSVRIQRDPEAEEQALVEVIQELRGRYKGELEEHVWGPWFIVTASNKLAMKGPFVFRAPDVKLYCRRCERLEPFNPLAFQDLIPPGRRPTVQVFSLSYVCQGCKSAPEVFLVSREGMTLWLSGRAPMEHVELPSVIPKEIKRFCRDAIVAHRTGYTLCANFLLRTAIEQWCRSATGNLTSLADDVLSQYRESLPKDFRSQFPSLPDLYSRLSGDIHEALGSRELFEESYHKLVEHFDARRLFRLSSRTALPASSSED